MKVINGNFKQNLGLATKLSIIRVMILVHCIKLHGLLCFPVLSSAFGEFMWTLHHERNRPVGCEKYRKIWNWRDWSSDNLPGKYQVLMCIYMKTYRN